MRNSEAGHKSENNLKSAKFFRKLRRIFLPDQTELFPPGAEVEGFQIRILQLNQLVILYNFQELHR